MSRDSVYLRHAALAVLAVILIACGKQDPEKLFAAGRELLNKQDYSAAVIQVKNGLQAQPESPEGRFLLGKILFEAGDAAGAVVELRKARDLRYSADAVTPLILDANLRLGKFDLVIEEAASKTVLGADAKTQVLTALAAAYGARGKKSDARKAIDEALALRPDSPAARMMQARLNATDGDLPGALAVIDAVIAGAPSNAEAHKLRGDVLGAQNQYDKAVASYRKAIELRQDFIAARAALIQTRLAVAQKNASIKDFDEAVADFEELKKRAARNPATLSLAAQIAFARRDYLAAREAAQQLLRFAPDAAAVQQFAGSVEYLLGAYVAAEAYLSRAVTLDPKSVPNRRWAALNFIATGQTNKAVAALEAVMPEVEKDPDLLVLAGDAYMRLGNFTKAEEMLVKATRLQPKDTDKRVALALVRINKSEDQEAYAELERVSVADKGTAAERALIASHMARREFDKALKAIDGFVRKEPNNPIVYELRASALLSKGRVAEARKSLERAVGLNPASYSAVETLANLDVQDGKQEDAARRLEAFITANQKSSQALLGLASLKLRTAAPADDVLALLKRAVGADPASQAARASLINFYLLQKDFAKAVAAGQEAAAAMPDSMIVLDALGKAYRSSGDVNQALATYGKLAAAQPNGVEAHTRAAEIYIDRKDSEAAISSLRKALAMRPELIDVHRMLVKVYVDSGRPKEALAAARELQKQRPQEPYGYQLEGEIHASARAYSEAAQAFRAGMKAAGAPQFAEKLHGVLMLGGMGADADKFASEWARDHPRDVRFRLYMAEASILRRDWPDALARTLDLLKAEPDNPALLNNAAYISGVLKKPEALGYAEKANKLAPNRPQFMDTLAQLLFESGDLARAVDLIGRAASAAPQNPAIKFSYARIMLKAGKKAESRKALEELAKLGDKFAGHEEVNKLLKTL